jgi:hypothetical protein
MSSSTPSAASVVLAAFAADSFALSTHWEYDAAVIHKKLGTVTAPLKPELNSYHSTKNAGDQSHIGDTALFLLAFLAANSPPFDVTAWRAYFVEKWSAHTAYSDHATKHVLSHPDASDDDDLSHPAHYFPLLLLLDRGADESALVSAAVAQTAILQSKPECSQSAEFLARVTYRVLVKRIKPSAAIGAVEAEMNSAFVTKQVRRGLEHVSKPTLETYQSFGEKKEFVRPTGNATVYTGLVCSVNVGLAAVVHAVVKYEDADVADALIADVNAGGNTVGRSIPIATILTAYHGNKSAKLTTWIDALTHKQEILDNIAAVESKSTRDL